MINIGFKTTYLNARLTDDAVLTVYSGAEVTVILAASIFDVTIIVDVPAASAMTIASAATASKELFGFSTL